MRKIYFIIIILVNISLTAFAQTMPVGDYSETIARRDQILGFSNDLSSFCVRPVSSAFNSVVDTDLIHMIGSKNYIHNVKFLGEPVVVKVLPFTWLSDYNSKLPSGYNNGPLYPNVGYQSMITGGVFIKAGILNIQFKPEIVHAENSPFLTFADVQANYKSGLIGAFYQKINGLDAPERFGPYGITHAGLGQSKITLSYAGVELGVSTENMWWGPGIQNSIMMSNSAPGFVHWTFNSTKPLKTYIGSFEWQLIGGILNQSGYTPYDPGHLIYGSDADYIPKPKVSRYLSAFTVNWQPKWISGLYIGASAYDYLDRDSTYKGKSFVRRVLPVFRPSSDVQNQTTINGKAIGDGQDFAYSAYVRQVLPKYNAEIYFEFARNDQAATITDFFLEPEHSSAYTIGARRLFTIGQDKYIQVAAEETHLQLPDTYLVRPEQSWYEHIISPRDGYTNEGRFIGAGIGPGSNSQIIDVSYISGHNSFGVSFERFVHDNDLYYEAFINTQNFSSHWVDLVNTFYANLKFKKYLISTQIAPVYVFNYEYLHGNMFNLHGRLTLTYYFD